MAKWLETGNYLIVHVPGYKPITLQRGSDKYETIKAQLAANASDDDLVKIMDLAGKIEVYSEGTFEVDREAGTITIDGEQVHGVIAERIVAFYKEGHPYLPLINFFRNIQQNPSEESKKHLYLFLEANRMPITHDGCFLGYKRVKRDRNGDLIDVYSGKFCNNVGAVVTMDRNKVNPDRNQTCSVGLHVAAFDYAFGQYSGSDLLEVKVNPKDVVAVPRDYNNQKMRVCRYEVVAINPGRPVIAEYIEKAIERGKRKHSQKKHKLSKVKAKQQTREEHERNLEALRSMRSGDSCDLRGLTAREIGSIVLAVAEEDIITGANLKNKKSLVKKAVRILEGVAITVLETDY